jgi:hypothetical protein
MIAGGGELSTAREVLKHSSVERVTLVDIDGAVVDAAQSYLASWGNTKEYLQVCCNLLHLTFYLLFRFLHVFVPLCSVCCDG